MDIAIKDKWLNVDSKCRLCSQLLCCTDHRIDHENRLHPKELRKILSTLNNNLNNSVSSVKVCRVARATPKDFKTPPTPASTRKRKREPVPVPENMATQHLLQTLSKKKKRRSNILPHLRTPRENPKSPLAIINNGVKNEILVENNTCMSAAKSTTSLMKTSSPFTGVHNADHSINMTPIENRSPETLGAFSTGGVKINKVEITPESGVSHMIASDISDMDISTNLSEANVPEAKLEILDKETNVNKEEASGAQRTESVPGTTDEIKESETNPIFRDERSQSENQPPQNESTTSVMSSPSFQDISMPLQLNSSDGNFSNGSNRSGNLSGFQLMLSPPDTEHNVNTKGENESGEKDIYCPDISCPTDRTKEGIALDASSPNRQDSSDEIFMTPNFNYTSESETHNSSVDDFRTPSEWENSTSVLAKYESKTPKCPVVYRTPKVLEHRIQKNEEVKKSPMPADGKETNHANSENINTEELTLKEIQSSDQNNQGQTVITGTVKFHQISFGFNNPENLVTLLQNPQDISSKRDSGFQSLDSETSNMHSVNHSNRVPVISEHSIIQKEQASNYSQALQEFSESLSESPRVNNESICYTSSPLRSRKDSDELSCNISLRDCNMMEDFPLRMDLGGFINTHLNISDPKEALSDRYICLNEGLKMHPNINYERRKNQDLLNCTFEFDINKFENESDLMSSPPKSIENESSMEISEELETQDNIESIGYIDSETKEIFIPVKCFESELSTIQEVSHFSIKNQISQSCDSLTEDDSELPTRGRRSSSFRLSLMSISSIQDETCQESVQLEDENGTVKNTTEESTVRQEDTENFSVDEITKIELKRNSMLPTDHVAHAVIEDGLQAATNKDSDDVDTEEQYESHQTLSSNSEDIDTSSRNEKSLSAILNYTITPKNIEPAESSLFLKYVSSITKKLVVLLPFRFTASKSCTVVDLDNFDYGEVEQHIRVRDPIREYVTTLEMCRRSLHPIEGRAPYYNRIPSVVTLKKEIGSDDWATPEKNEFIGTLEESEDGTGIKEEDQTMPCGSNNCLDTKEIGSVDFATPERNEFVETLEERDDRISIKEEDQTMPSGSNEPPTNSLDSLSRNSLTNDECLKSERINDVVTNNEEVQSPSY